MTQPIDLSPEHHRIVSNILYEHIPGREVLVFGSRAKWTAKNTSDLDMCIMGEEKLSARTLSQLAEAFDESPLPFKVDLAEWATTAENFRKIILRDGVKLGWPEVPLHELYDFSSGLSKPRSAFGSGYPFLSFKDVFYRFFVPKKLGELVNSTEKERALCSIKRGDVFLTRTSETMNELGMSCVALHDIPNGTFNGFTKRLRPKEDRRVVPEYAGYFFRSPVFRQAVTAMSSMATRASLNNEMLSRLSIILPSLPEQETIGNILGSLDDKIALNQRMNETLEAMARALFKSWFVDFDPVHAKAQGRAPAGMDAATAALFPSTFNDDGLPQGWNLSEIGKEATVCGGSTPSTKEPAFWDGDIHWTSPKDLSSLSHPVLIDTERRITQAGLEKISSGLLPQGTVLLSSRAPIGYIAIAEIPIAINQGYIGLIPDKRLSNIYIWLWLHENMETIKSRANGSTFQEISKSNFRPIPVVIPNEAVLALFEDTIRPIYQQIVNNVFQNKYLAELRDTLLPKLISGELRVGDAAPARKEAVG